MKKKKCKINIIHKKKHKQTKKQKPNQAWFATTVQSTTLTVYLVLYTTFPNLDSTVYQTKNKNKIQNDKTTTGDFPSIRIATNSETGKQEKHGAPVEIL